MCTLQQPESPEICSFLQFRDLCGKKLPVVCPIGERAIAVQEVGVNMSRKQLICLGLEWTWGLKYLGLPHL